MFWSQKRSSFSDRSGVVIILDTTVISVVFHMRINWSHKRKNVPILQSLSNRWEITGSISTVPTAQNPNNQVEIFGYHLYKNLRQHSSQDLESWKGQISFFCWHRWKHEEVTCTKWKLNEKQAERVWLCLYAKAMRSNRCQVKAARKWRSDASPAHRQEHMKQRVPMHRTETFPPNETFQHKTREGKTWLNGL